jgi:hypothetical protein
MGMIYIALKGASHDPAGFSCGPGGIIPADLVPVFQHAIDAGEIVDSMTYFDLANEDISLPMVDISTVNAEAMEGLD